MDNISLKRLSIMILFFLATGWAFNLLFQKEAVITTEEDQNRPASNTKANRKIASSDKAVQGQKVKTPTTSYRPSVDRNDIARVNEAPDSPTPYGEEEGLTEAPMAENSASSPTSESTHYGGSSSYSSGSSSASAGPKQGTHSPPSGNTVTQTAPQAAFSQGGSVTFGNVGSYVNNPVNNNPSSSHNNNNNSHIGNNLSCSASVPTGSYSYSLSVTLSCSSNATIKYCISEGGCCDPDSAQGATYTGGPIIIGNNNTQYCLSYYGLSSSSKPTAIAQRTYDINKVIPDLYVETPVTWMQTTEQPIYANINSHNFGKNNFSLAQVSYRTHDIGPDGDNLNCEEVATGMSYYTSPSPTFSLLPFSLAGLSTSQQVEIPLSPATLDYGLNHIATFIKDTNGTLPIYACSISEITLMDFEIFAADGISSNGEFTGGFTPFGFYEQDFTFPRSPAGQSSSGDNEKKIETAFLSILY